MIELRDYQVEAAHPGKSVANSQAEILQAFRDAGGKLKGESAAANYNTSEDYWKAQGMSPMEAAEAAKNARDNRAVDDQTADQANEELAAKILDGAVEAESKESAPVSKKVTEAIAAVPQEHRARAAKLVAKFSKSLNQYAAGFDRIKIVPGSLGTGGARFNPEGILEKPVSDAGSSRYGRANDGSGNQAGVQSTGDQLRPGNGEVGQGNVVPGRVEGQEGDSTPIQPAATGGGTPLIPVGQPGEAASKKLPPARFTELGETGVAYTDNNDPVEFRWAVIDIDDLVISNDDTGKINARYPQELQPRDRSTAGSQQQVNDIAQNANFDRLSVDNSVGSGAPIVGPEDAVAESGNGRLMGLRRAYENDMPSIRAYRAKLSAKAADFGLTAEAVAKVKRPVLVRVRQTLLDRRKFAEIANVSNVAPMREVEIAKKDAGNITADLVSLFNPSEEGDIFGSQNQTFLRAFVNRVIPQTERAAVIDSRGNLSQTGVRRVRNAIFAYAYGTDAEAMNALGRMTESVDADGKNITNALLSAAPKFAEQSALIKQGALYPLPITEDLIKAAQEIIDIRNRGEKVADSMAQGEMFGDRFTPFQKDIVLFLDKNSRSAKRITDTLRRYSSALDGMGNPQQAGFFDTEAPTKEGLWNIAKQPAPVSPLSSGDRRQSPQAWKKSYNKLFALQKSGVKLTPGQQLTLNRAERELGQGLMFTDGSDGVKEKFQEIHDQQSLFSSSRPERIRDENPKKNFEKVLMIYAEKYRDHGPKREKETDSQVISRLSKKYGTEKVTQTIKDFRQVEAQHAAVKPQFDKFIKGLAEQFQGRAEIPGLKGMARAVEKTLDKGRTAFQLKDVLRATIVVDSIPKAKQALAELQRVAEFSEPAEDRFAQPTEAGYMDALAVIKFENGTRAEIQISIPEMIAAKKIGHTQYELLRTQPTVKDRSQWNAQDLWIAESRELYQAAAWASEYRATRSANSSNEILEGGADRANSFAGMTTGRPPHQLVILPNGFPSSGSIDTGSPSSTKNLASGAKSEAFIQKDNTEQGADGQQKVLASSDRSTGQGFLFDLLSPTQQEEKKQQAELFDSAPLSEPQKASIVNQRRTNEPRRTKTSTRKTQPGGEIESPQGGVLGDLFSVLVGQRKAEFDPGLAGTAEGDLFGMDGREGVESRAGRGTPKGGRGGGVEGTLPDVGDTRHAGRGDRGGNTADSAGGGQRKSSVPSVKERPAPGTPERNFSFTRDAELAPRGTVSKLRANLEAIGIIKTLDTEGRLATAEEKAKLAKFSGWGALSQAFDDEKAERVERGEIETRRETAKRNRDDAGRYSSKDYYLSQAEMQEDEARKLENWKNQWGEAHQQLKSLLTEQEYRAAKRSTINAHYTSPEIIGAMWDMAERLGFKGGNVLEPGAGIGHFFGLMPEAIADRSKMFGVELDSYTAKILKALYPEADIQNTGFQTADIADNSIDLAVSNVPFANVPVVDKALEAMGGPVENLHDYFFGKSLTKLKPGGIQIFITSAFTMDKGNPEIRKWLSERADLVAAYRLPNDAFRANAGTDVVTDIIVMRKKDGKHFPHAKDWTALGDSTTQKGEPIRVNQYFAAHPQNILGLLDNDGSMFAGRKGDKKEMTVHSDPARPAKIALQQALADLPVGIIGSDSVPTDARTHLTAVKMGNIVNRDGKYFFQGQDNPDPDLNDPKNAGRVVRFLDVRNALNRQYDLELSEESTEADIEANRRELNAAYDRFKAEFSNFHDRKNKALFIDDPDYFRLMGAEIEANRDKGAAASILELAKRAASKREYVKADIFTKRVLEPRSEPKTAGSVEDAFGISLGWRGRVDTGFIAELTGQTAEQVERALIEREIAVRDPETGQIQSREQYLSGNVRKKLEVAKASGPDYARNVALLEPVQPQEVSIEEVRFKIGATWIPPQTYSDSLDEPIGQDAGGNPATRYDVTADRTERGPLGIEREETSALLNAAVDSLPEKPREIVRLSMQGMDGQAIADQLGISRQRVNMVLQNAYALLRKKLASQGLKGQEEGILFSSLRGDGNTPPMPEENRAAENQGQPSPGGRVAEVTDFSTDPAWADIAYKEPTAESIKRLKEWLKANPEAIVRMYHGTAAKFPVKEQGLLRTTANRRNSLQSRSGFVSLSIYPDMAKWFAKMAYPQQELAVYPVEVPVRMLVADTDQLKNKRMWADYKGGSSLAESIAIGHGAQIKGDVPLWAIKSPVNPESPAPSPGADLYSTNRGDGSVEDLLKELRKDMPSLAEIEAFRQRANAEPNGARTIGVPKKAKYSKDDETRRATDVVQQLREDRMARETVDGWIADAEAMLKRDRESVKKTLLQKALDPQKYGTFTATEVKAAQILVPELMRRAFKERSLALRKEAFALAWAYDAGGSEQARAFSARRDPFKSPAERHTEFLTKILSTPTAEQRKNIDAAPDAKERRSRLEAAQNERLEKIEKALADMGITLEDIFAGEAYLRLKGAAMVENAMATFDAKKRKAIRLIQDQFPDAEISRVTGLTIPQINALEAEFMAKLSARLDELGDDALDIKNFDIEALFSSAKPGIGEKLTVEERARRKAEIIRAMGFGRSESRNKKELIKRRKPKRRYPVSSYSGPVPTDDPVQAENLRQMGLEWDENRKAWNRNPNLPGNEPLPIEAMKQERIRYDIDQPWEYVKFDPANKDQVVRVARIMQATDGNALDMFYEYWMNAILSGPQTHATNILGNGAMATWEYLVQRPMEAAINSLVGDANSTQGISELTHIYRAAMPGIMNGWRAAVRAFSAEHDFFESDVLNSQIEFSDFDKGGNVRASIPGKTGRVVRIPGRALMAMDAFFKYSTGQMEAAGQAYRIAKAQGLTGEDMESEIRSQINMPGSMAWQRAVLKAKEMTFQQDMPEFMNKISNLRNLKNSTSLGGKLATLAFAMNLPFIKTTFNIFRTALRKSPLGAINVMAHVGEGLYSMKHGRPFIEGYSKAQLVRDMAEQALAWGATALLLGAIEGDDDDDKKWLLITGGRPFGVDNQGERDLLNRTSGGQYQIRIGGRDGFYFNYGRIDPFATVLGTVATAVRLGKTKRSSPILSRFPRAQAS